MLKDVIQSGAGQPGGSTAAIEAVALTAGYGRTVIVRDLSLTAAPGELVALLGPNGAGKSTTLATLAGYLPALSGEVRVHGRKTTEPLHRRARDGIAFVAEDRGVIRSLTVRDNIRLGRGDVAEVLEHFPELRRLLACCRAGSSRCSAWDVPCPGGRVCCSSTNCHWAWHRRW
jgi:branched-chain amino acid transport system ATP-binding protein